MDYIILIFVLIAGYLYWSKCRELSLLLKEVAPKLDNASILFFNCDIEQLLQEAQSMMSIIAQEGFKVTAQLEYPWGVEQRMIFINSEGRTINWVNYLICAGSEHPVFAVKVAGFDDKMTVDQTLSELQALPPNTTIYVKGEEFNEQ